MCDASIEPALLIGHSLGGAAVLAAAADLPNVKAIATIGAPFDVQHVTRLFGEHLQTLLEQGEAEVKLGGRPFKMRRSFIDDLSMLKTTPLASVVGVTELTFAGQMVSARTFQPAQVLAIVALCYLTLTLPVIVFARRLERRLRSPRAPDGGEAS